MNVLNAVHNYRHPGRDIILDPIEIDVPVLIIQHGKESEWHAQVLDEPAAERMQATINATLGVSTGGGSWAHIIRVPLILPSASDIDAVIESPSYLEVDPIRVVLRVPVEEGE